MQKCRCPLYRDCSDTRGGRDCFENVVKLVEEKFTSTNKSSATCSKCGSDSPIVSYCVNCIPKLKVASAQHL